MSSTAILLLAAGSSSRLGQPKQLLPLGGKPLLRYMAEAALDTAAGPVMVVLGAYANLLKDELHGLDIYVVINQNWSNGMASSIHCGIAELKKIAPDVENVLIMVCDQPYVTASLLRQLIKMHDQTKKPIVACAYSGTMGVPALFNKSLFGELMSLQGAEGAKKIIQKNSDAVAPIPFEKGNIDIDTIKDWKAFDEKNKE